MYFLVIAIALDESIVQRLIGIGYNKGTRE